MYGSIWLKHMSSAAILLLRYARYIDDAPSLDHHVLFKTGLLEAWRAPNAVGKEGSTLAVKTSTKSSSADDLEKKAGL